MPGFFTYMRKEDKQKIWQLFLWANIGFVFYYWVLHNRGLVFASTAESMIAFGRLFGLLAAVTVLLQFFFMGRTPYLERVFGLDKLANIHHTNGKLSLVFILLHPVLLIYGFSRLSGVSLYSQLMDFLLHYEDVAKALVGFILFIVVVGTSIYIVRKHLKYESWYFVHLLTYVAVGLSFGHQFSVGTDLLLSKIFYGYWVGLYVFVFGNHVFFRFGRPIYNFYKYRFEVDRVVRETHNAVSIYIKGRDLEKFKVLPGQFMIFRFLDKERWWQAHPFSLSMVKSGGEIRITPKALGDFTSALPELKPGTKVVIDGPYGVFMSIFGAADKVLLIAGGIGITPIRSLLEELVQKGRDVILLYGNRSSKDVVFEREIAEIAERGRVKVVHVLSEDKEFSGERGIIDEEKIRRLVPDLGSREVYLCGPPKMMEGLLGVLYRLGVIGKRLHYERFSLT